MPVHAISELAAAAERSGLASTDAHGVHIELDRRRPDEHRLAVAQRYQHPDRRLIERICADLGWPKADVERRNKFAGVMRITIVSYRPRAARKDLAAQQPPAPGPARLEQPVLVASPLTQEVGDPQPTAPVLDKADTNARFAAFHAANPHVYVALRDTARLLVAQGETRIGVKRLYEELRGQARTAGDEPYRLNNIFTSRYARILDQEPDLAGKIELRKLRS